MDIRDQFDSMLSALSKMGEVAQAKDEIYRLKKQNIELDTTCGSCYHWMTKKCPRETPKNKVSCGQPKCSQFKKKDWCVKLASKNEEEIQKHIETIERVTNHRLTP